MSLTTSFKFLAAAAALVTAVALSACSTTPGDRAVSGGLLGAGAGAATGALTDPCMLNLGDPYWRQNGGDDAYYARCGRR